MDCSPISGPDVFIFNRDRFLSKSFYNRDMRYSIVFVIALNIPLAGCNPLVAPSNDSVQLLSPSDFQSFVADFPSEISSDLVLSQNGSVQVRSNQEWQIKYNQDMLHTYGGDALIDGFTETLSLSIWHRSNDVACLIFLARLDQEVGTIYARNWDERTSDYNIASLYFGLPNSLDLPDAFYRDKDVTSEAYMAISRGWKFEFGPNHKILNVLQFELDHNYLSTIFCRARYDLDYREREFLRSNVRRLIKFPRMESENEAVRNVGANNSLR